ncbi:cytochrome oxidase c subunit VIb-domain-containing protein [Mrakia frigida]|uniref:Coa6p n=1 Tax=Mrakia frigida TaxID=29902 RepID=UPI003FCC0D0A
MAPTPAPSAPSRQERKLCWGGRDRYFACLDAAGVVEAGKEGRGTCETEGKEYEANCAKSWIHYFNERRIQEARLRARFIADEARGVDVRGLRYGPDDPKKNYSGSG